jgi:uncharacterized protein YegL
LLLNQSKIQTVITNNTQLIISHIQLFKMISIQVNIISTGKTATLEIDESITISAFMRQIKNMELISPERICHLRTTSGKIHPSSEIFRNILDREFELVLGFPPLKAAIEQLGIFVIDGSGSMLDGHVDQSTTFVDAVKIAIKETIKRFKESKKIEYFLFAVIAFGNEAIKALDITAVVDIDPNLEFISTDYFENGAGSSSTHISTGLSLALELASSFVQNPDAVVSRKVEVVLLTDGICHTPEKTKLVAKELKKNPAFRLHSCHLTTNELDNEVVALLKEISYTYAIVYDKGTIRDFFIASTSTNVSL